MSALQNDEIEIGRRIDRRFAVEVEAEVTTEAGTFGAITRDVSRGGACFLVLAPMAVGSGFSIALSLVLGANTFSEPLRINGRVVWCTRTAEGFQIGAAFEPLDAATKEFLQMFLSFLARGIDAVHGQAADDEHDDEDDTGEKGLFA
jgi:hypothetical protein